MSIIYVAELYSRKEFVNSSSLLPDDLAESCYNSIQVKRSHEPTLEPVYQLKNNQKQINTFYK